MGLRQVRRLVVFVIGMTVLLLGVIMLVTPGPAIVVIPAGLAILGLEFRWARRLLRRARRFISRRQPTPKTVPDPPSNSSAKTPS